MKISELPEEIRLKALEYQRNHNLNKTTDILSFAFQWITTVEGGDYWKELDSKQP